MRIVAAPDKFRGTATATEVTAAISRAAAVAGWACDGVPLADGGEGTLDAIGGPNRTSRVTGPLGEQVEAAWRPDGNTAVIEMARASGLALAGGPAGNDPMTASSIGTGELVVAAVNSGATRLIVGVGGSATTDGGEGALGAIAASPCRRKIQLVVACDVRTAFLDAADVFAPQKGARGGSGAAAATSPGWCNSPTEILNMGAPSSPRSWCRRARCDRGLRRMTPTATR